MGSTRESQGGSAARIIAGVILGTVPGLALMAVNLIVVEGEAQLTVGVLAIMITAAGAVVGGVLGAQRDMRAVPMGIGALVGAVPGLLAFLGPTRLALVILVVGALAGGLVAGALTRRPPRANDGS